MNMKIREENRTWIHELERVISVALPRFYMRKNYDGPSLLVIPNGQSLREFLFHVQIKSNKIEFSFTHHLMKESFLFFLIQNKYIKRKNSSKILFESTVDFQSFLNEINKFSF